MSTAVVARRQESSPLFTPDIAAILSIAAVLSGGAAAFVRSQLVVSGDAIATAAKILAHEPLFRAVFVGDGIAAVCYFAVTLFFCEMFKPLNKPLSIFTAVFNVIGCAIVGVASLFQLAAWAVLRGAQMFQLLVVPLKSVALIFLKLRAEIYSISLIFFAISCVLLACLIVRSTFFGRKELV